MYVRGVVLVALLAAIVLGVAVTRGLITWAFPVEVAILVAMSLVVRRMRPIERQMDWKVTAEWRQAPDSPERREFFTAAHRRALTGFALTIALAAGLVLALFDLYFWYASTSDLGVG